MRKKISTIIAICAASVLLMTSMDAVAVSTTDDVVNNETAAASMGDVNIDGTFDAADSVARGCLLYFFDHIFLKQARHGECSPCFAACIFSC